MVWPIGTGLVLGFAFLFAAGTDPVSAGYVWRGVWILIGILALIVWVFRFTLPESPRYLATHGRGDEAIKILERPRHCRPDRAAVDRRREQQQERSVRRRVQDVPEARHRRHDLLHGVLRHRHRARRLAAEHHGRKGFRHHQVAAIHAGDELRGAVRQHLHDVRARQIRPQDHGDLHLHPGRRDGDCVRPCRDRDRTDRYRLRHDLLRSGRRQFDADFHVRSVPDQRARVGLRLGLGRRAADDRRYHAVDTVGAERLGA